DGRSVRLQPFDDHPSHEVALAEHTSQFPVVDDQNRSDVQFRHSSGNVANALRLFYAEQFPLVQNISYSRHLGPSCKLVSATISHSFPGGKGWKGTENPV